EPISIPHIKKYSLSKHVKSTSEYSKLWHLMFDNARQYNTEDSQVYEDANILQGVLDETLQKLIITHNVPG
ncbi:hypothetical protein B0H10DRAFT_1745639, partial [Mycena sp. CBHHK59/15]